MHTIEAVVLEDLKLTVLAATPPRRRRKT